MFKKESNSKERIEKTFKKERTDKVPINHRGFSSKVASYILGREAFVGGGIQQWREAKSLWEGWHDEYLTRSFKDAVDISLRTGQDMLRPQYWCYTVKPTKKIDEYTYLYEYGAEEDRKILRYDPVSEQASILPYKAKRITLEHLSKIVKEREKTIADYKPIEEDYSFPIKAQKLYGKEKVVEVGGVGIGIPITEANIWLEAMLLDPSIIKSYITLQVEAARKNVEFLSKLGFHYFFGGGDFASERGPMYSPKLFQELILPGIKEVSKICHQHNGYHLFASDGNLWPVAQLLFGESGIDGYFEIDRKAGMDLETLRVKFPALTLIGNISSWTLARGKKEDVREEALSCLEAAKKYGGIIVGVSNYILSETPQENIDIMLDILDKKR